MLENYAKKGEKAFKKTLRNEATCIRKKRGMHSIVRNIIMISGYFYTDTKPTKKLNFPKKGESRHGRQ